MHLIPIWLLALMVVGGFGLIWWLIHRVFIKPKQAQALRSKTEKSRRTDGDVEQILRQLPQGQSPGLTVVKGGDPEGSRSSDLEIAAAAEEARSRIGKNGRAN